MLVIHLEFLLGQYFVPEHSLRNHCLIGAAIYIRAFDRTTIGVIAFEMGGVDLYPLNDTRQPKFNNNPVIAGFTPPPGFPTIPHINGSP